MATAEQKTTVMGILATLADTGGAPAGSLYTFVGMDMEKWEFYRDLMLHEKWVTISAGHWVSLTPKGKELADRINAALERSKQSKSRQ